MTFLLLLALNAATLAPCASPSALYLPQLVTFARGAGFIYLTSIAVATTFVVMGLVRFIRCAAVRVPSGIAIPVVAALLMLPSFALLAAAAFYVKFAAYPELVIAKHVVTDPSDSLDYIRSSVAIVDVALILTAVAAMSGLAVAVARRTWREKPVLRRAAFNVLVGAGLLWGFRASPAQSATIRVLVGEHSMPAAKYLYQAAAAFDSNRIEAAQPFIPTAAADVGLPDLPQARHVVLVIAECLRADRLPAYGYARQTTPFIQSEADQWVVFDRAYSHGSATAESFPPLFNAQYFAAITRSSDGARAAWRYLRDRGVRSAFLSASAMEWGAITQALAVADMDHQFVASNGPADLEGGGRRFDFTVDDSIPLSRYRELLEREFVSHPSFATIHFVGSHYPFRYEDTPDVFLPSMRQPPGTAIEQISNSYDNSIVHIDGLVKQIVEALERFGLADDSVVVVTSDHGESLGEHQTFFHGTTLYDEQVRVPLLFRVGNRLQPLRARLERRRAIVAGQVDFVPTMLHMLSGRAPSAEPFDGVSLMTDRRKPYEMLLYRGVGEKAAFLKDGRKYIFDLQGQRAEEYALSEDPGERRNLWTGDERSILQFTDTLVKRGVLVRRAP